MNAQRRKEIEKACEQFNTLDNKVGEYRAELETLKKDFERIRDERDELIGYMRAIEARLHGEWDSPDLIKVGFLTAESDNDILHITKKALLYYPPTHEKA